MFCRIKQVTMQFNLTRVHFQVLERGKLLTISMFLENNTLVRCFCLEEKKLQFI